MEYKIIVHPEEKYLEVITQGTADQDGSLQMARAVQQKMSEIQMTKVLFDHRLLTSVTGKIIEIYNRPVAWISMGVVMKVKMAELINPEHKDVFGFLETVSLNQGYSIALFEDRDTAVEWLLK